jgi:hypothetical protein
MKMKKRLLGSLFVAFIVSIIVLNVSITFSDNNHSYNVNLNQLESLADNENGNELKTYACESGSGWLKRCESVSNRFSDCDYSNEQSCNDGSGTGGSSDTDKCVMWGHLSSPCLRCGYGDSYHLPTQSGDHKWEITRIFSDRSFIYTCTKCGRFAHVRSEPQGTSCPVP